MMEDTGGGSSIQRVDVMDTSEDALPDGWPASVVVNGKTWNGSRKSGYIIYVSPDEMRTTQRFGKVRLRNHVRIDTSQPLQKWDGVYHVTFYTVADGTNCDGVESGNSICLHTYFRCGMILSYDDGDIEGLNRWHFQSQINGISRDFWHSIEGDIKKTVGLGLNEYQILSPVRAFQEGLIGSWVVYYEVGPGVVRKIAESSGYWKVELKGCTLRSIVHGSRPEQKFVQSGFAVWMDASLLR